APGHLAVKFTNPSGTIEWTPAALHVGSKVRMDQTIFGEDFSYLKSQVSTAVPKQTIPSPNMVHYRGGPAMLDPEVYPDIEEFWSDLAAAYADEVQRLNQLGCTYLQYDDERSGGFEPLRFVPKGKMVVLGLVTTKRPELESKDDLKRRIDEAAKFVPLDQICLSGQCGFSSTFEGNALTYDEQVAQLRLIVETAQEVWGN